MSAAERGTLAMLLEYFRDPAVDEVLLNGAAVTLARVGGRWRQLPAAFADDDALLDFLLEFAAERELRLDPALGSAGGELAELPGRWHCVLAPLSRDGPLLCLRRHRFHVLTLADFAISAPIRAALAEVVAAGAPLLIAGPTASGKTSLLAALLRQYAGDERVVVIESVAELPRLRVSWVRLAERVPSLAGNGGVHAERLLAEALRLSPDRLVLGEIRGREARAFVAAMRTGHAGLMATLHAGDPAQARARLRALAETVELPDVAVVVLARGQPPRAISFSASATTASIEACDRIST